jgi:ABC-type transporter Mla MlaB component
MLAAGRQQEEERRDGRSIGRIQEQIPGMTAMQIYQHDNSDAFRVRLIGQLSAQAAAELERCWRSASSILGSRPLIIDVSEVAGFDEAGIRLLIRLRDEGALFTATEGRTGEFSDLLEAGLQIGTRPRSRTLWKLPVISVPKFVRPLARTATRALSFCKRWFGRA